MVARDVDYHYVACIGCGLVALDPASSSDPADLYPPDYVPHAPPGREKREKLINRLAARYYYDVSSRGRSSLLRAVFALLSGRILREIRAPHGDNRLLDVGCGSGALLERYRSLGWSVQGIEAARPAVEACRARGIEVHHGTLDDAPLGRTFDVIVMSHVIEHVRDPIATLRAAASRLAPAGKILLTTPNVGGIGFRLFRSSWFALDAPRHRFLFERRTLRLLAARAGLRVRRLHTRDDPAVLGMSYHYVRTQGMRLPPGLERRREILQRSRRKPPPSKLVTKIAVLPASLAAPLGFGEVLEAELEL